MDVATISAQVKTAHSFEPATIKIESVRIDSQGEVILRVFKCGIVCDVRLSTGQAHMVAAGIAEALKGGAT